MTPRQWYRFENQAADPSVVDIHIIDVIAGWDEDWIARNFGYDMGVTARAFVEELANLSAEVKTVRVHINSPGGDVFAAANIANALREQQASKGRAVETIIDGMAASAASVVAMAGSTVRMADNALFMIHNPWSIGIGEAKNFRKLADDLDKVRATIVATYRWHSSLSEDDIVALMDAETWMDATEALDRGFVTDKVEGLKAAASISPAAVAALKVPEQFRARVDALVTKPAPAPAARVAAAAADVLRLCREHDCLDQAEGFLAEGLSLEEVTAKATAAKAAREAAAARASEIRAICATAKLPELADAFINGQMSPADVRAQVVVITAKLDAIEIDAGLGPNHGAPDHGTSWTHAFARIKQVPGRRMN